MTAASNQQIIKRKKKNHIKNAGKTTPRQTTIYSTIHTNKRRVPDRSIYFFLLTCSDVFFFLFFLFFFLEHIFLASDLAIDEAFGYLKRVMKAVGCPAVCVTSKSNKKTTKIKHKPTWCRSQSFFFKKSNYRRVARTLLVVICPYNARNSLSPSFPKVVHKLAQKKKPFSASRFSPEF